MQQRFNADFMTSDDRRRLSDLQADRERITQYADHLGHADRAMIKGVFERGMSPTAFAAANERSPKHVFRRLRRALDRLNSPMLDFILRHRAEWPEFRRRVAEAIFIRGQKQREAAQFLGTSLYQVRQEAHRIRVMFELWSDSMPAGKERLDANR
jgi:DNA-directed RNA polymerase specialized sigma24 family protein